MKKIKFAAFILVVALVSLTSGCVFIPTPHYYAVGSRQNVTAQSTNLIQLDADTIEDVMLKLGEPDAVSPDERKIAYSFEKVVGFLIFIGVPAPDEPEITRQHFVNFAFNGNGVATNLEFSTHQPTMLTGLIGGEKIKIGFQSWQYSGQYQMVAGSLMLTESALYFSKQTQWLNEQPSLSLRYDSFTGCVWAKDGVDSPTLTVRTKDGQTYSFAICGWGRSAQNAVESACDLVKSKINSTQPEK